MGYVGEVTVLWLCSLAMLPLSIFEMRTGRRKRAKRLLVLWIFAAALILSSALFTIAYSHLSRGL